MSNNEISVSPQFLTDYSTILDIQNTKIYMCQSLLTVHYIKVLWALYCYVYSHTTVFRQSGELSHHRLENQVLSLKYFFNGAIAPARCTSAGVGASSFIGCNLHSMIYCSKYIQISVLDMW